MCAQITICEFERRYQDAAADLINSGLGEHFGVVDATMNPLRVCTSHQIVVGVGSGREF